MRILGRFLERRRLRRRKKALIAKLVSAAVQVMVRGDRFAIPDDAFDDPEDVSEFLSRLCIASEMHVRAYISDGLLLVYPDEGQDGLGVTVAGVEH